MIFFLWKYLQILWIQHNLYPILVWKWWSFCEPFRNVRFRVAFHVFFVGSEGLNLPSFVSHVTWMERTSFRIIWMFKTRKTSLSNQMLTKKTFLGLKEISFSNGKTVSKKGVNRLFWLEKNQNPSVADGFSAISHQKLNQPSGIHPPPRK